MKHKLQNSIATLFLLAAPVCVMADQPAPIAETMLSAKTTGEVKIRSVLPLSAAQRAELSRIAATEPEAGVLLQERVREARGLLQTKARPLAVIHYEGLVNTEERRIETVKHLEDMDDAAAIFEAWQATGNAAFAAKAREYLSAWAAAYKPTGNDVNENKLLPLFTIYEAMRADFDVEERERIDAWLTEIALKQIESGRDRKQRRTNRHTKRLAIVSAIGLALKRPEWLEYSASGFKEFVEHHLYADGTSFDLHHRDTLTYHNSALRPLLDLAVLAARNGQDLYRWVSPSGSSLQKSVDYVRPYASGEKQRAEWTNSKVELDRKRAAARLEEYQAGSLFEPKRALPMLEDALFFDASLLPLVIKLTDSKATKFPTWRTVINAASRVVTPSNPA